MINQRPAGVFFDWDGTLVNTLPFLFSAHNFVRVELGFEPWQLHEFKENVKYSSRELYAKIYGERAQQAMDILAKHMSENHIEKLEVLPDSFELIDYLLKQAIPCGIVSNKRHEFLLKEVAHLGWENHAQVIIGAGFSERDKPAADPLLDALKACELSAGPDIWYIGDSEADMITANEAGCSAVLVRHNHDNEHLVESYNPFMVLDDCEALRQVLIGTEEGIQKKG